MADRGPMFRLHASGTVIGVSAAVVAVFAVRAFLAADGVASTSGPVWATLYGLIALASLARCFDRIVVSPDGITMYRAGIPRRVRADQLHQLLFVEKSAKWARLYAETVEGKRVLITAERRTTDGQIRMRQLWDHAHMFLGPQFRPLTPEAA
jgi:hypothetical protein